MTLTQVNSWTGRPNHLDGVVDGGRCGGARDAAKRLVASDMQLDPRAFRVDLDGGLGVVRVDDQQRLLTGRDRTTRYQGTQRQLTREEAWRSSGGCGVRTRSEDGAGKRAESYLGTVEADPCVSDGGMCVDVARKLRADPTGRAVVEHLLRIIYV